MSRNHEVRIKLHMSVQDIVFALSEGNPGAIHACIDIITNAGKVDPLDFMGGLGTLLSLDTQGIYGSRLYVLYNDVCGRDVGKLCALMRANQLGQLANVDDDSIDEAIDTSRNGDKRAFVMEEVIEAVKKRLDGEFYPERAAA